MNTPERRGGRKHGRGNGAIGGIWARECTKAKKREEGGRDWLVGAIAVQQIKRRRSKRSCTFASGQAGLCTGPTSAVSVADVEGDCTKGSTSKQQRCCAARVKTPTTPTTPTTPATPTTPKTRAKGRGEAAKSMDSRALAACSTVDCGRGRCGALLVVVVVDLGLVVLAALVLLVVVELSPGSLYSS